jgi:hypothetical protein
MLPATCLQDIDGGKRRHADRAQASIPKGTMASAVPPEGLNNICRVISHLDDGAWRIEDYEIS